MELQLSPLASAAGRSFFLSSHSSSSLSSKTFTNGEFDKGGSRARRESNADADGCRLVADGREGIGRCADDGGSTAASHICGDGNQHNRRQNKYQEEKEGIDGW